MMIHFIIPGDTLEKIAKEIRLENPVYLKEYHNKHCTREDYISGDLIAGKKLLLPDFAKIRTYNDKNDAPFKSPDVNPKIDFNPNNFNRKFKVTVTESASEEGKSKQNRFSYIAHLQWISYELGEHLFHFSKDQFSNQQETKMETLAIDSIKSINPIEVYVNSNGEILRTRITKHCLNNFKSIREKLLDFFPDQYSKIYLEEFEYVVLNQEVFDKKMKEDWFLKNYFSAFRNPFKNGKSFFEINLNQTHLNIEQTVQLSDSNKEIKLNQSLKNKKEMHDVFNANMTVSKESGMIKEVNVVHSYKEYAVIYSTDFSIKML